MDNAWDLVSAVSAEAVAATAAALSALLSLLAIRQNSRTQEKTLAAQRRHISLDAIRALSDEYASERMHKALRNIGSFVENREINRALRRLAELIHDNELDAILRTDFIDEAGNVLAVDFENCLICASDIYSREELVYDRRYIHHFFKRIHVLYKSEVLLRENLVLFCGSHEGFALWRNNILPLMILESLRNEVVSDQIDRAPERQAHFWAVQLIKTVGSEFADSFG